MSRAGWEWQHKPAPWGLERRKDRQSRKPCPKAWKTTAKSILGPASLLPEASCSLGLREAVLETGSSTQGLREGQDPQSCLRMGTRADGHWGVPWHLRGCQAGVSREWQPLGSSKRSFLPVWDGAWRDGREFWALCWLQESGCDGVVGLLKDISGCLCPPCGDTAPSTPLLGWLPFRIPAPAWSRDHRMV